MRSAGMVCILDLRIDTEMAIKRCEHILRTFRIIGGLGPMSIRSSHNSPAPNAAACHGGAENVRPMIASGVGVHFGGSAKFTPGDHHGCSEQPPLVQVLDERAVSPVPTREKAVAHRIEAL